MDAAGEERAETLAPPAIASRGKSPSVNGVEARVAFKAPAAVRDLGGPPPASAPSFAGAVLLVLPLLPFVVALSIGAMYVSPVQGDLPSWVLPNIFAVGLVVGLVISGAVAAVYCYVLRGTAADHANASAYSEQCQRLLELEARLAVSCSRPGLSSIQLVAALRAEACQTLIRRQLQTPGLRWILGVGYTSVWPLIHRAEEALLLVEAPDEVLGVALFDQLRMEDSTLPMRKALQGRLDGAIAALGEHPDDANARMCVSQVRATINQFRDTNSDALVRCRNHLMVTLFVTGVTALLLFCLAVAGQGPLERNNPHALVTDPVIAASVVFLVGALIGLFARLYQEAGVDTAVEDYGLAVARLTLTPVLSGVAAVGGVLVIAFLPFLVNGDALMPSAQREIQQQAVRAIPALGSIYNLQANPLGIALAAIFGLTPSLLVNALQRGADSARAALKSTNVSSTARQK